MQDDSVFYRVKKPKRFEVCILLFLVVGFLVAGICSHQNNHAHQNNQGNGQASSVGK